MSDFNVGDHVIWDHQMHGGYGYVIAVPAIVIGKTAKRIRISAQRQNKPPKLVTVRPESLRKVS